MWQTATAATAADCSVNADDDLVVSVRRLLYDLTVYMNITTYMHRRADGQSAVTIQLLLSVSGYCYMRASYAGKVGIVLDGVCVSVSVYAQISATASQNLITWQEYVSRGWTLKVTAS